MAFTVAVVSVPLRSPPALGSWPEATVPDICDIKPGCHVETLEFHITAWPLTGAVFATARFCMPVTVAAVNVPLTSPPAAGSWLEPAVPDIWQKRRGHVPSRRLHFQPNIGYCRLQPASRGGRRCERHVDSRHGDRHTKPGRGEHGSSQWPSGDMEFERFNVAAGLDIADIGHGRLRPTTQCGRRSQRHADYRHGKSHSRPAGGQHVSEQRPSPGVELGGVRVAAVERLGSGSGASMAYQLGDLVAVRTSSTVLSIGGGCAPTSPCNVRFGYLVYSITNSATATVSGSGIGTAYVYVNG